MLRFVEKRTGDIQFSPKNASGEPLEEAISSADELDMEQTEEPEVEQATESFAEAQNSNEETNDAQETPKFYLIFLLGDSSSECFSCWYCKGWKCFVP